MKPHARLRLLSAVVGGMGVVGMGMAGMSLGDHYVAPETVLAPATGQMTHGSGADGVTTTTSPVSSFHPVLTASPPPPPLDD